MELDFTPEQQQIKDAVRRFLSRECPPGLVRRMREDGAALPRDIWRRMANLGWLGLPFAESHGGAGSDWVTLAALLADPGSWQRSAATALAAAPDRGRAHAEPGQP